MQTHPRNPLLLVLSLALLWLSACTAAVPLVATPTPTPESLSQVPPSTTSTPVLENPTQVIGNETATAQSCQPTRADVEGPFYKSGAPQRDKVGEGYMLQGVVRSSADCAPIPGAQIEFWMAGPDGEYTDNYRASEIVGEDGAYRFESHFPPPYSGRPSHIHLRVSAKGFQTLITQHYPQKGDTGAILDLVLIIPP